jgi:hypothetical protein
MALSSSDVRGIASRRREISPRAQMLYLLVLDDLREGRPFPSTASLAGALGTTERTVRLRLRELVDCGEVVLLARGELWIRRESPAAADSV